MKFSRILAVLLSIILLINSTYLVDAKENVNTELIKISDTEFLKISRTKDTIKSEYYQDNVLMDYSIANYDSEIILYYDKRKDNNLNAMEKFFRLFQKDKVTKEYKISDFLQPNTHFQERSFRNKKEEVVDPIYHYIKTLTFTKYGNELTRELYGE